MIKLKIVILLPILILLLSGSPALSQNPSMKSNPGMGMRPWRKEARCWRAAELNLSFEQEKGLRLIQQTYLRETQLLRSQLFSKRLELREWLTNPAIRMESIRPKYMEMAEIQSRLEDRAIEYLIRVRGLLTQEQLRFWCPEQEFPLFHRMMQGMNPMGPMSPPPPPQE